MHFPDRETKQELRHFRKAHNLSREAIFSILAQAIASVMRCRKVFNRNVEATNDLNSKNPAYKLCSNLVERCFERVDAVLCALASNCPAAALLLTRAAIEAAFNIRYICAEDPPLRLAAYLQDFLRQKQNSSNAWAKSLAQTDLTEREIVVAVANRRKEVTAFEKAIERFEMQARQFCNGRPIPEWPRRIESRFEAIGELAFYRHTYAKLSADVHLDAEETILYSVLEGCTDRQLIDKIMASQGGGIFATSFRAAEHLLRAQLAFAQAFHVSEVSTLLEAHVEYQQMLQGTVVDLSRGRDPFRN